MDRSKKLLYGGIAATVVVAVVVSIVVIVLLMRPHSKVQPKSIECVPSKNKPDLKTLKVTNFGSTDLTAVANLAGYVHLRKDDSYLPLDIDTVTVINPYKGGSHQVIFSGKCTSVNLVYNDENSLYSYKDLTVLVKTYAKKDTKQKEICKVSQLYTAKHPTSLRYSCKGEEHHDCKLLLPEELVADLVLESFELELNTKPFAVKNAIFEKPAWDNSCKLW
jgi:hypothetical protein